MEGAAVINGEIEHRDINAGRSGVARRLDRERPPLHPYGIRTFNLICIAAAMAKSAAIVSNRAHPALMVFGPGGL